ncbi:hypothetical protein EG328_010992 [Venturia inaequalis]|uniref:CENP-V/GFA domain-containing protein n=1 Tax=Venturia inaequalis TaxID=5025 RepID=A0A8H3V8F0_VENIN|nr:hypothetical protein EG328_010992 [Venturia inaequalis]KAE9983926.1 hypothetical protein EG327_005290 [Venturia inaequalis]
MAGNPVTPLTGDPSTHDKTDTLVGSCLCGSITVTITDSELWTKKRGHLCHCSNCRKVAGAPYGSNLIIEEEKVKIVDRDGTRKEFLDYKSFSGKPVKRNFCGVDGNPICSITENLPGKIILKMGIYPRIPEPEFETFADHRHDWQGTHGIPQFKIRVGGEKIE